VNTRTGEAFAFGPKTVSHPTGIYMLSEIFAWRKTGELRTLTPRRTQFGESASSWRCARPCSARRGGSYPYALEDPRRSMVDREQGLDPSSRPRWLSSPLRPFVAGHAPSSGRVYTHLRSSVVPTRKAKELRGHLGARAAGGDSARCDEPQSKAVAPGTRKAAQRRLSRKTW
jgi:hypothetical protein